MIRYGMEAKVGPPSGRHPRRDRLLGVQAAERDLHQRVDREMCVDDRWTMVTSAPFSQSAPQMSKAELLDPMTTHRLAPVGIRARVRRGVVLVAAERVHAREGRDIGLAGHPRGQHQPPGPEHERLAVPLDGHRPFPRRLVVAGALGLGAGPVVELHDPGVGLEPVGDLVFGENTGQLSGNFRYGMWSYQTGSCRQRLLYRLRHWSPGRGALVDDDRGTLSCRSRAGEPDAGLPPPTISTYGCCVTPSSAASWARFSSQEVRSRFAPCSAPFGRLGPFGSS